MLKRFSTVTIICALLLVLGACHKDQSQEQQASAPTPVVVAKPDQRHVQQTIPVSGTVVSPFAPTPLLFFACRKDRPSRVA